MTPSRNGGRPNVWRQQGRGGGEEQQDRVRVAFGSPRGYIALLCDPLELGYAKIKKGGHGHDTKINHNADIAANKEKQRLVKKTAPETLPWNGPRTAPSHVLRQRFLEFVFDACMYADQRGDAAVFVRMQKQ